MPDTTTPENPLVEVPVVTVVMVVAQKFRMMKILVLWFFSYSMPPTCDLSAQSEKILENAYFRALHTLCRHPREETLPLREENTWSHYLDRIDRCKLAPVDHHRERAP